MNKKPGAHESLSNLLAESLVDLCACRARTFRVKCQTEQLKGGALPHKLQLLAVPSGTLIGIQNDPTSKNQGLYYVDPN